MDLRETIDTWNSLSRVQTGIGRVVNDVIVFPVSVGSLPLSSLVVGSFLKTS